MVFSNAPHPDPHEAPTSSSPSPHRGPPRGDTAPLFRLSNALGFEVALTDVCAERAGTAVLFVGRGGDGRRLTTLRSLEAHAGSLRARGITPLVVAVTSTVESLAMTTSGRLTFDVLCDEDGLVHQGYRLDLDSDEASLFAIDRQGVVRAGVEINVGDELSAPTTNAVFDALDG